MEYNVLQRRLRFCITFIISIVLFISVSAAYVSNKSQLDYLRMENLVDTWSSKINYTITNLLYKAEVLSALVIQNDGEIEDFEKIAATIIDDPCIRNIVVAPNGVVSDVYPLTGNEALLGFDFFSDMAGNKEAIAAKESGTLVMGGPFTLVQGGQAIVGRLPVYMKNPAGDRYFWGLVSITLNYPDALMVSGIAELQNQGYAFEIWRINPDTGEKQIIAASSYAYNKNAAYIEKPLEILNAKWNFKLSPIKSWYQYPETWILSFLSVLIGFLAALLVVHNYDLQLMKVRLEELSHQDPLTGIKNRRGLMHEVDRLIASNTKFILAYLDLNKFKIINDTYGHDMGDQLLNRFTNIVSDTLWENYVFARIGGDEFIIIRKGNTDRADMDKILQDIQQRLNADEIGAHHSEVLVTFSYGCAEYPKDGKTIDELMSYADKRLYEMKNEE